MTSKHFESKSLRSTTGRSDIVTSEGVGRLQIRCTTASSLPPSPRQEVVLLTSLRLVLWGYGPSCSRSLCPDRLRGLDQTPCTRSQLDQTPGELSLYGNSLPQTRALGDGTRQGWVAQGLKAPNTYQGRPAWSVASGPRKERSRTEPLFCPHGSFVEGSWASHFLIPGFNCLTSQRGYRVPIFSGPLRGSTERREEKVLCETAASLGPTLAAAQPGLGEDPG